MNFEEKLSAKVEQVNRSLLEALPNREVKPARLHEAIRHSAEAGGKRLRPVLLLAAQDLFPVRGIRWQPPSRSSVFIPTV